MHDTENGLSLEAGREIFLLDGCRSPAYELRNEAVVPLQDGVADRP
jgi:hypothetical protein